jgi:hypothetical protein
MGARFWRASVLFPLAFDFLFLNQEFLLLLGSFLLSCFWVPAFLFRLFAFWRGADFRLSRTKTGNFSTAGARIRLTG